MLPMLRIPVSKVPGLESASVTFLETEAAADAAAEATASAAALADDVTVAAAAGVDEVATLECEAAPRYPKEPILRRKRGNESVMKGWEVRKPRWVLGVAEVAAVAVETRFSRTATAVEATVGWVAFAGSAIVIFRDVESGLLLRPRSSSSLGELS